MQHSNIVQHSKYFFIRSLLPILTLVSKAQSFIPFPTVSHALSFSSNVAFSLFKVLYSIKFRQLGLAFGVPHKCDLLMLNDLQLMTLF